MTHIEQALLDLLHRDSERVADGRLHDWPDRDWRALVELATIQRVRPQIWERLRTAGLDKATPILEAGLREQCRSIAMRNLRLHGHLGELLDRFHTRGIEVVLLKGAHVASACYGSVARREIGDLDLLVDPNQAHDAVALLGERGYASQRPFSVEVDMAVGHHLTPLHLAPDYAVELHWAICPPDQLHSIDTAPLWARRTPVSIAGRLAAALSDEDLALHLSAHCAYVHRFEFGVRSLCDLERLAASKGTSIRWDLVAARADEWGWTRGVSLVVGLANTLLGAGIPERYFPHAREATTVMGPIAAAQLVARPESGLHLAFSALEERQGWRDILSFVHGRLALPVARRKKQYPRIPLMFVPAVRVMDIAVRHSRGMARRWFRRERTLLVRARHQKDLTRWLATS